MHRVCLNSPPQDEPGDIFEEDLGMMDADEKSPDNFEQPFHKKRLSGVHAGSTYPLLVPLERPNSLQFSQNSDPVIQGIIARTTGIFSRNSRVSPLFPSQSQAHRNNDIDNTSPSQASSDDINQNTQSDQDILQLLGDSNSIVRTVKITQSARRLRQEVLAMLLSKSNRTNSSIAKSEPVITTDTTVTKESSKTAANNIASQNVEDTANHQNYNKNNTNCDPRAQKCEELFEIRNEVDEPTSTSPVERSQSWETSVVRGACALLLSASGFSDCSLHALDILVDLMIYFVKDIGRNLVLIGDQGETGIISFPEQLQVISESGFRGGLMDLLSYRKIDLGRMEQAAIDTKGRLELQLEAVRRATSFANSQMNVQEVVTVPDPMNTSKDEGVVREEENVVGTERNIVDLGSEAFAFGYLNKKVRLDVLGGLRVPLPLAYDETGQLDIGDVMTNDESKPNIVSAQGQNSTRIKAESQLEDENRWASGIF